jgi:FixJ family two-component response regulator
VIVDDDASFLKAAQTFLESDGVMVAGMASTCAERSSASRRCSRMSC